MRSSEKRQTHIRFTEDEYSQLLNDSEVYGETVPNLMKAVYFRKKLLQPVMNREDALQVLTALNRIGNNANQIARQLNSGFRQGFNSMVEELRNDIQSMKHYILGLRGNS
ncbi:MAG: plasmid mobilization relaxosome protein MobC [Oligoflexales bacterium]